MDLIIKPTEKCNFLCTFCSSTKIAKERGDYLDVGQVTRFLAQFPTTRTIIVNGGDPLMMPPRYYHDILDYIEEKGLPTILSFTSNLWGFKENPERWASLFNRKQVGVITSFQYGGGRLKGDGTELIEEDYREIHALFLKHCGYGLDFISVIGPSNVDRAIDNVLLAKELGVDCKLNYVMASGEPVVRKGVVMGHRHDHFLLADIYEIYVEIVKRGLAQWEYNSRQMLMSMRNEPTTCPLNRRCDEGIRTLQPSGDYYSCGAFGDDKEYPIDFDSEMEGMRYRSLLQPELDSLKVSCYGCPMFSICNGCKKTIAEMKRLGIVEKHCVKMKTLAPEIIALSGVDREVTPYVDESNRINIEVIA